ncbi:related to phosphoglycerate mutase family protein [Phialocephala subalpina]|uniref:Related to phosphoglycerate mutase family protein n=1 Tax=Phialocephala subalpina TaxID=576137 RepID=A0A1L7WSS4_9HELO|nr:related to phosphoglycerate mutase family protein [Phialocephala subalpina]
MLFKQLLLPFLAATVSAQSTVYLIRHGEKPADGSNGLTAQGQQRAQCLRTVFGASSSYDIGYIIAEQPKASQSSSSLPSPTNDVLTGYAGGARTRPLMTVQPLANDLGLTVDTSCDRDDQNCVADLVDGFEGGGNILICWEHDNLSDIVKALGDKNPPDYPDDSFNIIWTDPSPYNTITATASEDCPGLDSS